VLGIVFATSAGDPQQAYALTDAEITKDLEKAKTSSSPVDTASLACAA
jgi:hypothetical protein